VFEDDFTQNGDGPDASSGTIPAEPAEDSLVLRLPDSAILVDGTTFYEGTDDGLCRVIRPDGSRCRRVRIKAYGVCGGHAGTTPLARDPAAHSRLAHASLREARTRRATLGIGARRIGSARAHARLKALERVEELADALIAPLDDEDLSSVARQVAALRLLDAVEPVQSVSLSLDVPDDPDAVSSLDWQSMQALAASLLSE